jgi:outer membrane biosynthesis protein TonB
MEESMEELQYHAAIDDKQEGPFNAGQLMKLIKEGKLDRETLVWKAGMPEWIPAKKVSELDPIFAPPPAPEAAPAPQPKPQPKPEPQPQSKSTQQQQPEPTPQPEPKPKKMSTKDKVLTAIVIVVAVAAALFVLELLFG